MSRVAEHRYCVKPYANEIDPENHYSMGSFIDTKIYDNLNFCDCETNPIC